MKMMMFAADVNVDYVISFNFPSRWWVIRYLFPRNYLSLHQVLFKCIIYYNLLKSPLNYESISTIYIIFDNSLDNQFK